VVLQIHQHFRGPDNNIQTAPPLEKIKGPNLTPHDVQGLGTNLGEQFAAEPTRAQTGARDLFGDITSE